jgi:hypothetical protein
MTAKKNQEVNEKKEYNQSDEKLISEALKKVKDPKLLNALKIYRETGNSFAILDILDYFGIKVRMDTIDMVIPKFYVDKDILYLGALVVNGEMYRIDINLGENISIGVHHDYFILTYGITRGGKVVTREGSPDNK